jgi:putative membrane protein
VDENNLQEVLSTARRQSPAAIVLILARFFRRLARQAWPLVIILFFRQGEQGWLAYALYFAIAISVFSMIASIAAYWRFYFYTTPEEFVIERGIFNKVKLSVPYHRIQTISFQRNVLHRLLGVVGLDIDTAGSNTNELSIQALTEAEARLVRQFLLEKRGMAPQGAAGEGAEAASTASSPDQLLLQLGIPDLLKIGFSQNHLRTAGIILAFLFGLYEFAEDILGDAANKQAEAFGVWLMNSFLLFLLIIVPLLLVAAFLLSLVRTVLQYYNLRFFQTTGGYRVISGLFNEQERNAALTKIQLVQWQNNPLYRWFGMYSIQLKQASSAVVNNRQAITIPGAYAGQVKVVREAYFPVNNPELFTEHGIHPAVIGRRVLYWGLAPAIVLILLTLSPLGWKAFWWLLLIPVAWQAARIYHRNWKLSLHPDGCRLEHGIWNNYQTVLQWYKVQAVELRQTPYQRRRKLANLYLYTAAGEVSIPYLPLVKATMLKDYILFCVETDRRSWM